MAYKVLYIPLFIVFVVETVKTNDFFVNNSVTSLPSRNITCSWILDYIIVLPTLRNFSLPFAPVNSTMRSDNGLCVYHQRNITLHDGSLVNTTVAGAFDKNHSYAQDIFKQYINNIIKS